MTRSKIAGLLTLATLIFSQLLFVAPTKASSATLYLSPSTGTYVINGSFKVSVLVNTDGADVNAAEGAVTYDTDLLEAVSVAKGNIFMFWTTEPTIGGGSIRFGGGNPSPYKGKNGHVITITFKAKKSGKAQVRFSSGAVLANDGRGTNILASMGSGSYTISPKVDAPAESGSASQAQRETPKAEVPKVEVETEYNKPVIKSSTHPDQNTWYLNKDAHFSWDLPSGVNGVSFSLDGKPVSDPGGNSDGLVSEKTFENLSSGIQYFHLKLRDSRRWGTVAHHRVMVDLNPPSPFKIEVKNIDAGEWPVIEFETKDEESGLAKYEVYVGSLDHQSHILEPDKKSVELTGLEPGHHTVLVKAIDKAGNQRIETVQFVIEPIPSPEILNYSNEVRPDDKFYLSGKSLPGSQVLVFIEKDMNLIASSSSKADSNGNWFYIHPEKLDNGRYTAYAKAINEKGIQSEAGAKISFLVSPPVFAVIGAFIIDYFTVFASLLFVVVLIIVLILLLVLFVRRRLRKEAVEVEEVLKRNLNSFRTEIKNEYEAISAKDTRPKKKEKEESRERLLKKLSEAEGRIMKEVKDVEDILK